MPGEIRPLFGLEFEMSFSALDQHAHRISSGQIMQTFMSLAGSRFAHLPAHDSSGIFLGNGGRLYLDCGKPEITTPEVTTPTDACRYSRAAEEILLDVSRALMSEMPHVKQVIMTRGNVSYSGCGNAWACHESYGHRCDENIAEGFIPHAVSRIVYTGAGGFDNRSQGIRFLISPRVAHLHCVASENTQRNRGIFNTKDEPLNSGGYHRLHVICGESESSIRAQWLKMATTAVVIAMVQAGMAPGTGLRLHSPLKAIRDFAQDTTLTATALTQGGRRLTALDIQRQLLEKAKRLTVAGPINDWLPDCCQLWEETLEQLQQQATAVRRGIDWAIKFELFRNYVQRRGLTWERLATWSGMLERLDALPQDAESCGGAPGVTLNNVTLNNVTLNNRRRAAHLRRLRHEVDPRGTLEWDELELVLTVRQELFEIDTRFGELGSRGIFNCLDAQGLLEHHVAGVEDIQQAMTQPPAAGRARLRGLAIQSIFQQQRPGACEWDAVWDYHGVRLLDLSDPFAREETWISLTDATGHGGDRHMRVARAFDQTVSLYDRGQYESASRMLRVVVEWMSMLGAEMPRECCRFSAWIQAHRGYTDGLSWLETAYRTGPRTLSEICDYLLVYRFQGLRPGPEFHHWCDVGRQQLAGSRDAEPRDIVALRCSHAFDLLCQDRPVESWNAYHDDIPMEWYDTVHRRYFARILTEKADVLRRLGRFGEARTLLADAQQTQVDGHYDGDLADLTLMQQAKIAVQTDQLTHAWELLERALQTQRDAANVVGEARTLLLMGRIHAGIGNVRTDRTVNEILERVTQICAARPALAACAQTRSILGQWDNWVAGETLANHADPFAGL